MLVEAVDFFFGASAVGDAAAAVAVAGEALLQAVIMSANAVRTVLSRQDNKPESDV